MDLNLRSGRILGSVPYANGAEKAASIPLGPCLLEQLDDDRVEVIWGNAGQGSAILSKAELEAAATSGGLVLLDVAQ